MNLIKSILNDFLVALGFLTRIPIGSRIVFDPINLQRATYYFPAIAWFISLLLVFMYSVVSMIFPLSISVFLVVICSVIVTGALHEDGLADVCDAFGVMGDAEKKIAVMKDSRLGTFGVLGLILVITGKYLFLSEQSNLILGILVSVLLSRLVAYSCMLSSSYLKTQGSKTSGFMGMSKPLLIFSIVLAMLPLYFLLPLQQIGILIVLLCLLRLILLRLFVRQFKGVNGDCLGFVQQISELMILLVLI